MNKKELSKIKKQNTVRLKSIFSRKAIYYSPEFDQIYIRPHLLVKSKESPDWQKNLVFIDWLEEEDRERLVDAWRLRQDVEKLINGDL